MGRNSATLTEKQVRTLEWIRDGCPAVDDETDVSRRISASSLHRRGLVTVKGRGTSWKAAISKAGSAWLEQHPKPEAGTVDAGPDDLWVRMQAAGRELVVGDGPAVKEAYQELVRLGNHAPGRPQGWRLVLKSTYWGGGPHRVAMVRYWEDFVDLVPVRVPGHVARYHPVVREFLADRDWQMVTKDHLARAARILQAVVDEAVRRGMGVLTAEQAKPGLQTHHASEVGRGQLVLRASAGPCGIRIRELSGPGGKPQQRHYGPQRSGRPKWLDFRDTEFVSTGDLELTAEGPGIGFNAYRIRDSRTMALEERLPRVFRRIDIHRLESEWREQERERQAAERRRRWEAAMEKARTRYDEHARWEVFAERSREWQDVRRDREFLALAMEAADLLDGSARD